ncbi:MAG: glycerophosphoryl diester phosphodiesterase membrane domain-containing protein [Arthrobacter sp.]|uniref:glycerophosphoryl diester phosphodiesterase membrane domain-containing protein n=1 Tax=Arthrobacter sp. TaxID=1667 RepID=UPI00349A4AA7
MTDQPPNPYAAPGPRDGDAPSPAEAPPGEASPLGWSAPAQQDWSAPPQQGWAAPPQQGWAAPVQNSWGQPVAAQPQIGHGYAPPRKPGVVPLRPLGIGDLLDGSFQAIRRNPGSTLGLSVLVQLVSGVVIALLSAPLYSVVLSPDVLAGAEPDPEALTGSLLLFGGGVLLAGVLSAAFLVFVQGLVTVPVLRAVLDRRTGFGAALALARPSMGALIGLGLLWAAAGIVLTGLLVGAVVVAIALGEPQVGVPVVAALFLGVLGTLVWVGIKLSMSPHALVAEGLGPFAAMGRSWGLTRSSWWRCLGIILLTGLIVGIVTSLITTPISFATGLGGGMIAPEDPNGFAEYIMNLTIVMTILSALAAGLGFAYQCGVTSLLYTDLRIRREGFDLALLREFDAGADAGIPGRTTSGDR